MGCGGGGVSVMSADVDSVPEHSDGGQVALDAGEVLNVVEPSGHVGVLLPLLDGTVNLRVTRSEVRGNI